MAESVDIFVASEAPPAAFVKEVEALLQLQFRPAGDQYESWYEAVTAEGRLTIGTHELENDRDLPFEDFTYDITFWARRDLTEKQIEQVRQTVGRRIFAALKQTNKYALMLVDDVQIKLDEYRLQQAAAQ